MFDLYCHHHCLAYKPTTSFCRVRLIANLEPYKPRTGLRRNRSAKAIIKSKTMSPVIPFIIDNEGGKGGDDGGEMLGEHISGGAPCPTSSLLPRPAAHSFLSIRPPCASPASTDHGHLTRSSKRHIVVAPRQFSAPLYSADFGPSRYHSEYLLSANRDIGPFSLMQFRLLVPFGPRSLQYTFPSVSVPTLNL
ncbi:uncharacterized protein ARMOST_06271 [Armillaria ostoyae]|uniref:Uncharacterized protein n=1 Tax=Armillaria ostoyae TaxID=47428 RepID=A0A284R2I7_ARMOS|nr:uncharacterized protein ARMOST_06271 [Armillaria ostoyae]